MFSIAWTNDSFELWYLLHFEYLHSAIDRSQYKKKLTEYIMRNSQRKYEKNDPDLANILSDYRLVALRNAKKLEKLYDESVPNSQKNPGTSVHKLVEKIIDLESKIERNNIVSKTNEN